MIYRLLKVSLLVAMLSSCGGGSSAPGATIDETGGIGIGAAFGEDTSRYRIELSGAQALPPVDTRESGIAEFVLNKSTGQLYGTVTTSLVAPTGVHIHEGDSTQVGAEVVALIDSGNTVGNRVFNLPADFFLSAAQIELFETGQLYVDIHASDVALRGQLSALQPEVSVAAELDDLQVKLFTPVCSGCHTGSGTGLPSIMDLSNADATYASLVSVYSIGEPSLLRVEPGNTSESLLLRKLEGTQAVGARMPFRGAMLDSDTIAAVRQWIALGAGR